ncbi:DUF11 domain-containing protein [Oceanithermus desulfurans]|uniref:DUF11 domain-containing protein n=2 Tax=Oceanithermus desulfurans TaxID=227924 RepID=A0A511RPT3_9DEIN|nr:DUF11 domain-containing protein [Oceanithermus desulfurans]MBB6031005.1 hypothetical protein [Oceanithermus desulfurans]GEM90786.1 hypothetical protein ODE01S_22200 [Oceanithermus desulfurans NBRC 100063]
MKRLSYLFFFLLAQLAVGALGQVGQHPLVIPGTELGWDTARLELVLRVTETTPVVLKVFSPGFDPNDYRSPDELGDERYDGGTDELKTLIRIFDASGTLRLRKEYGNEPHRWYTLINGDLASGDYLIDMQFFGNGKNALAFKLLADAAKATLQVAPGSMTTYNVHGPKWQYPFRFSRRGWEAPIRVGVFDGDGPRELEVRVERPDGRVTPLPTPGNGEWTRLLVDEAGTYRFGFRQPEGARQYTNTVGFQIFLDPVVVEVVDEQGRAVEGAAYVTRGYYDRTVVLNGVPEGWTHVATEVRNGRKLDETHALFGPGGGAVRFVLRPKTGVLEVRAAAVCDAVRTPAPLTLTLGDHRVTLDEQGRAELALPAGRYPVQLSVPGASVRAPADVEVRPGARTRLDLVLEPRLRLGLTADPAAASVGESFRIRARLASDYPFPLPAELDLAAPAGVELEGAASASGTVFAARPLELELQARAVKAGSYTLRAVATPCTAEASVRLTVHEPAAFGLEKRALTPEVTPGGTARFLLRVTNRGGAAGSVRLRDALPAGLSGAELNRTLSLEPGEVREIELTARVAQDARGTLENIAYLEQDGREVARAQASVTVLAPGAELARTLDKRIVVPGEGIEVCLQLSNPGKAPLVYTLDDAFPDWVEPLEPPHFRGELPPGGKTEHCYPARVQAGGEATGRFQAVLQSNAGELTAPDTLRRVPAGLAKSVTPKRLQAGEAATFHVEVKNPTDHPLTLRLVETPEAGLGMEAEEATVTLQPGEARSFAYPAHPEAPGDYVNRAAVFVGEVPAADPVEAALTVFEPLTLERSSTVRLPFAVEGKGDALIVRHAVPEGARYRLGSSRLDGAPVADPRVDSEGRLYWLLPFEAQGELTYALEHSDALPPLAEPELTLLTGDRELALVGEPLKQAYEGARRLAGGEGVPTRAVRPGEPGTVAVEPVKAVADGRTPLRVRVVRYGGDGEPEGDGYLTLQTRPEPITPDAAPEISGYQVRLQGGVAEVELEPAPSPGMARVRVADGELRYDESFYVPAPERTLWFAQGSITARYGGGFELGGLARGYLEAPIAGGTLEGALDTQANLTAAGLGVHPGLGDEERPDRRYPLTGSGEEAQEPLLSDDGVALRYQREDVTAGYYRTPLALPALSGMPRATALVGQYRGDVNAGAFVALLPGSETTEEIVPDGTRVYALAQPVRAGSEQVILREGALETRLQPLRDYVLDAASGTLTLAEPLWPRDAYGAPVRLVVTYAPASAPRDTLALGAGAVYRRGPFSFGAAAATLDQGASWKLGAELGYTTPAFSAAVSYGLDAGRQVFGLRASGREGAFSAGGNLRYDGQLQGSLRVAGALSDRNTLAFEHRGTSLYNRTSLLFERRLSDRLEAGAGLGYEWSTGSLEALGRVGYRDGATRLTLTHAQSFSVAPSLTTLSLRRAIDADLAATGELAYTWGRGLSGTLGLTQRLGPANLHLDYLLPNASGRGNRARFGIEAPFPVSERVSLDVFAGYEQSLASPDRRAAAGAGVRYQEDDLSATFGIEGSVGTGGSKLTLRSGASGRLDERQAVSFDANYSFGGPSRGRFTLAYAYRGRVLQFLTYHRLRSGTATQLEGEFAPTWHPSLAFQLRPSAAYRIDFADAAANLYQIGLGGNYYFGGRFGVGAGAYLLWQPAAAASHTAFNLEGSLRLADPVWLNLGYTFGGFAGLTPESRPGVYLRLDLFGRGR